MSEFIVKYNAGDNLAATRFTGRHDRSVVTLHFSAALGINYTLQYSPDVSTLTDVGSAASIGSSANCTRTASADERFLPRENTDGSLGHAASIP